MDHINFSKSSKQYELPQRHNTDKTSKIPVLVVLIGIPGSGKSTFATTEERFKGMVRINLDTLGTRQEEMCLLSESFAQRKSIIVDNTNVNAKERSRYIPVARALGYRVEGYFLQSRLKDCIERNNRREGKARIPVLGVINRQREMELPRKSEGFDALYFVTMKEEAGFDVTPYKEPRDTNASQGHNRGNLQHYKASQPKSMSQPSKETSETSPSVSTQPPLET